MNEIENKNAVSQTKFYFNFLLWWFLWGTAMSIIGMVVASIVFSITGNTGVSVFRVLGIIIVIAITFKLTSDSLELAINTLEKRSIYVYKNNVKKILVLSIIILSVVNIYNFLPEIIKTESTINRMNSVETISELSFTDQLTIKFRQGSDEVTFEEAREKVINDLRSSYLVSTIMSLIMIVGDFFIVFILEKKFLDKICIKQVEDSNIIEELNL